MRKEIMTRININATPEKVWSILTDFEDYPNWNPFVAWLKGEVKVGNTIEVSLPGMKFKPKVLTFDKPNEFRWLGSLLMKGIFDGEHIFKIEKDQNGTVVFHHGEKFGGILVPVFSKMLDTKIKRGFEALNEKLKQKCEE